MRTVLALAVLVVSTGPGSLLAQTDPTPTEADPPAGRVVADTVAAPSLDGNLLGDPIRQPALVYLPPGYDADTDRRYATIYLLHGILDRPSVWVEPVYGGMTIQAAMDRLIAAGEIEPAIVVMPSGHNAYGASMYMNGPVTGDWGDFIARDVVAHVDATYRTRPRPESRAITGHSMGGFGAVRLAMLHPDIFGVAWGMNPCCLCCLGAEMPADHPVWRTLETLDSPRAMWRHLEAEGDVWPLIAAGPGAVLAPEPDRPPLYFEPIHRVEGDSVVPTGAAARMEARLPMATVADHVENLRALRALGFDVAYDDQFAHIAPSTIAFSDTLTALEVPHVFEAYAGDHRNRMSERLPGRILPWIDGRLVHRDPPRSTVEGRTVTIRTWPPVEIEVDDAFAHAGSDAFELYDTADAEIHVFVDADGPVVDRLLWLQVEEVLPSSDHVYDYSELDREFEIGPLEFDADARHGEAYSMENVDSEGDVARVLGVLEEAGYRLPDPMMRLRMVALDESGRRELLSIYIEGLAERGLDRERLARDDAEWERVVEGLIERARATMEIAPR